MKTAVLHHVIPDIGCRLEADGHVVTYSGDTGYTSALVVLAQQSDILILECANDEGQVSKYHLTPEECGRIATEAAAKHLVITHYGKLERQAALAAATQQQFHGILTFGNSETRLCIS